MVCIMRCKKYEPDNVKQLVQEIILKQNPKFKNILEKEIKTWPLYFTPKIIRSRSNFNFFAFHFSSKIMQNIRNLFLKFLVKRRFFVKRYLGKVYNN